jgi:hypothetical protein
MEFPNIEEAWPKRLRELLHSSPIVADIVIGRAPRASELDGEAEFRVGGEPHQLLVECKPSGQPRYARMAIGQLGPELSSRSTAQAGGIVAAPFISPASRAILAESSIGWLDLAGNARIVFPRFHLEINKADRDPFATKREQRSLFFPKSARLLKLLLHKPQQPWKVAELAAEAGVSAGQVSNVRRALIEREWAHAELGGGFRLVQPDALLDAWRDDGVQIPQVLLRAYALMHSRSLDAAIEDAFADAADKPARLLLASHSVARRVAPFARVAGEFFYADSAGLAMLQQHLQLAPADKGENVIVFSAGDDGLWQETMQLGQKLNATGPIQTYLDLLAGGERAREAAEHWRAEKIKPLLEQQA